MLLALWSATGWAQARSHTIGFAHSDSADCDWCKPNIGSLLHAVAASGIERVFKDAGGNTAPQRRHVREPIEQKVDAIVRSAKEVKGWDEALFKARQTRIPVLLSGRTITLAPENRNKVRHGQRLGRTPATGV